MNTTAGAIKRRAIIKNIASLELEMKILCPIKNRFCVLEEDVHKSSFLAKLFAILSNKQISSIINWCEDGERFHIIQGDRFQNEVIPMYFKHRNLKSFIRQLNLHGFKKLRSKTKQSDQTQEVYKHHFFRRDQPELVSFIKRKISKPVEGDEKTEQIVCLIEKQKELQFKLTELMNTQVPATRTPVRLAEETHNQDLATLMNALEVFTSSHPPFVYQIHEHRGVFRITIQVVHSTNPTGERDSRHTQLEKYQMYSIQAA